MDGRKPRRLAVAGMHPLAQAVSRRLGELGHGVVRPGEAADGLIDAAHCGVAAAGLRERLAAAADGVASPHGSALYLALLDGPAVAQGFADSGFAGLVAFVRAEALRAAPRARVDAVVAGASTEDALRAVELVLACPSLTGQVLALDADPHTLPSGRDGLAAPAGAGLRRVFVRDLVLGARIGVFRRERGAEQRIRINLELGVRDEPPDDDRLAGVVDYDRIVAGIRGIVAEGHINLVETLAERIAATCLADPRVRVARVRVEKPDVYGDAAGAGVEIERRNMNP